ncbi:MAG: TIGR03620 family F420-dependent LLM class oxidoreductase [Myxococcota bacterium]
MPRGALVMTEQFEAEALLELAQKLDQRGYDSVWIPELFAREPIATAGYLLGRTRRIAVGTAIANVYVRDPHATAQVRQTLAELSGGRFLLGLGVSNAMVNAARGHEWQPPLAKMRAYLDAMDAVKVMGPAPAKPCPTYIAAHGPHLQRLGALRTNGIITYLMTPEHTRQARERIGPAAEINPVALFLAERDPGVARRMAREALKPYMGLEYYHREWRKLGFADADFASGGSDRLVDALVAWGDAQSLRKRAAAFESAGATRVIAIAIGMQTASGIDFAALDALAP